MAKPEKSLILSIDQGTTGTTCVVFDAGGRALSKINLEITQHYPKPGWVEHDLEEIWASTLSGISKALRKAGASGKDIVGIGITNQRETTGLWDDSGKPLHRAIVWQCRRTAGICEKLKEAGLEKEVRKRTGLVIDAYFSGPKIRWLLDRVSGSRQAARKGKVRFGTIDSWLIWNLTGGARHVTDPSNASRTMIFNIQTLKWDDELLAEMKIPASILPEITPSAGVLGKTRGVRGLPDGIPICGVAGDQQAALFGQTCFSAGESKNTYGTGSFLLMNVGEKPVFSKKGLIATVAWRIGDKTVYALEGSTFIAGAVMQWLRDEIGLIADAAESEKLARSVEDNGGVYLVPAFVGLGSPHWDMYARGTLVGLTRGSSRAHIVRAALESMAYQSRDMAEAMEAESGVKLKTLRVDGGAAANDFLMQFQADILGAPVDRPKTIETTALGAALLAGLGVGLWPSIDRLRKIRARDREFAPQMKKNRRDSLYADWKRAVNLARGWVQP